MYGKSMVPLLVVAAVGLTAPASTAVPGSSVANGRRCGGLAFTDPAGETGEHAVGQLTAGPLAAAATGASIQITCTIQVGGANSTHAGVDADSVTSTVSPQVASIPRTEDDQPPTIRFVAPENVPVFLCTQAIVNGTSWYWDATVAAEGPVDQLDTATGWTTNPGALCNEAPPQEIWPGPAGDALCAILPGLYPGDPTGAVYIGPDGDLFVAGIWILDCPPEDNIPDVVFPDQHLCPVLISLAGSYAGGVVVVDADGDVYVAGSRQWDCPVYGDTGEAGADSGDSDDNTATVWIFCAGSATTTLCV